MEGGFYAEIRAMQRFLMAFLCCWGCGAVAHQMARVAAKRRRCLVDMVAVRLGRATRILGEMVVMRGV